MQFASAHQNFNQSVLFSRQISLARFSIQQNINPSEHLDQDLEEHYSIFNDYYMNSKFATGMSWRRTNYFIVPDKPSFPDEEVKVLKYWEEINAFHKQLELSEGKPEYTFYDGPPFATGLPHYGHIAAGTIKVSKDWRVWN